MQPTPSRSAPALPWRSLYAFIKDVADAFVEKNVMRIAASLAFYSLFSLAPLVILLVVAISFLWGSQPADVQATLLNEIGDIMGEDVQGTIAVMLTDVNRPDTSSNFWSGLVGIALTAVGATVVFGQLQAALNDLWEVRPKPEYGLRGLFLPRLISLGLILFTGLVMVVAFVLNIVVDTLFRPFQDILPWSMWWLEVLNYGVVIGLMTVILAALYRFLPDVTMRWRVTWLGAGLTSLLFAVGREAIAWYLGTSAVRSAYGAAGSLVVLLFWVYYSSTLLLLGAVITYVTSRQLGFAIVPAPHAEVVKLRTESTLEPLPITQPVLPTVPTPVPPKRSYWKLGLVFLAGWGLGRSQRRR